MSDNKDPEELADAKRPERDYAEPEESEPVGGPAGGRGEEALERMRGAGGPPEGGGRGPVNVRLVRAEGPKTHDQNLWELIRDASHRVSFERYSQWMDAYLTDSAFRKEQNGSNGRAALPFSHVNAYGLLKNGTATFLETQCGIVPTDEGKGSRRTLDGYKLYSTAELERRLERYAVRTGRKGDGDTKVLPYLSIIRRKLGEYPLSDTEQNERGDDIHAVYSIIQERLVNPPMVELIWSYWHEEGMLAHSMAVLARRFQNVRAPGRDPLANMELDALRPLNNVLWGYVQDEQHRLTPVRRAYEYDHHYGFTLHGKQLQNFHPADSRTRFLEAFHNLLKLTYDFYGKSDDTTVIADGFPLLAGLKEVHLLLTQGGHNQYGDLPWTARQEMLMQQWILARPELREFVGGRIMVAYPEQWMDRVDALKSLHGWDDTSSVHFRDLGVFGEQILLSIRYGAWSASMDPDRAANWASFWRPVIQGYIHAYRAVTGVDLRAEQMDPRSAGDRYLPPSVHLRNRLHAGRPR